MAGAGTEAPRAGEPVAAVDREALAVGEELAAHGDVVVVGGEHLGEAVVGQVGAAANDDGRFAMPIQPNEPSCQAISIQVSIISAKVGSTPPAATGLNADISPLPHIASTIAGVSVRIRSDSAASPRTSSRIPRANPTTWSAVSAIDVMSISNH